MPLNNLSPDDVKQALDTGNVLLIDVREDHEFALGHIEGAILMPLSQLSELDLPKADDKTIILYCAGGVRSVKAAHICQLRGLKADNHLAGGINAWRAAGLPVK